MENIFNTKEQETLLQIMQLENNCIKVMQGVEAHKKNYLFDLVRTDIQLITNYKHLIKSYALFGLGSKKINDRIEEDINFIDTKLKEWGY